MPSDTEEARGRLVRTISYEDNRLVREHIDAMTLKFYEYGTLGNDTPAISIPPFGQRWYANEYSGTNANRQPILIELIDADILHDPGVGPQTFRAIDYQNGDFRITFGYLNTRRYANPKLFAAFIGALSQPRLC